MRALHAHLAWALSPKDGPRPTTGWLVDWPSRCGRWLEDPRVDKATANSTACIGEAAFRARPGPTTTTTATSGRPEDVGKGGSAPGTFLSEDAILSLFLVIERL